MSSDPNKKSARTFQCRDVLWETFEQMARELECSVDYLINEAMKQYARQRSYGTRTPFPPGAGSGAGSMPPSSVEPRPPTHANTYSRTGGALPPPPGRSAAPGAGLRPSGGPLPAPPGRAGGMHGLPAPPPRTGGGMGGGMSGSMPPVPGRSVPPPPRSVPPPLPRPPSGMPPMHGGGGGGMGMGGQNGYGAAAASHGVGQLSVVYQGEKMAISKDRFVIGRGKQSSDLTLKDPNVSRQHAMIEFQNGVYFMVDMGSTNGVEYNGQRIARKQIAEGDTFKICDHDLRFTYR